MISRRAKHIALRRHTFMGSLPRAKPFLWIAFCIALLFYPLSLQAEVRSSSNFKVQADGLAPAINMGSSSFKLFSIVGDGRAVKLSSSNNHKLGSSIVYVIGGRSIEDSLCFPIHLKGKKSAVVCL